MSSVRAESLPGDWSSMLRGFENVEFAARRRPGFRNCVVPVWEVPALVRRYGAFGCYATFYLFDGGLRAYAEAHRRGDSPSVAGYTGPVFAPVWPLDVDAADLGEALEAARGVWWRLTRSWKIPEAALQAYFSGMKGFHVTVDTRVFGLSTPSVAAPEMLHRLTLRLSRELGFASTGPLDLALRDRVRLLRLPNTRHEQSGLFKVPLEPREFLELGPAELRGFAKRPRPLPDCDPAGLLSAREVSPVQTARYRWSEEARPSGVAASPGARAAIFEPAESALLCPARQRLRGSPAPVGQRNNVAIRLASWFREAGKGSEEVLALVKQWNGRNRPPLADEEVAHVVASAFARETPYHFGCRDPLIASACPEGAEAVCPYHRPRGGAA